MNIKTLAGLLALAAVAGCAAPGAETDARGGGEATEDTSTSIAALPAPAAAEDAERAEAAAEHTDGAAPAEASAPRRATPADELEIWNDPDFRRRFVESYVAETDVEPAITIGDRERMEEILELLAADETDEAVELLREARAESGNAVFDFTLANIHYQRDELDPAAVAYQQAVDAFSNFRRAHKNLGLIHVRRGDFEEAARSFTRVIELGGGDAVTYGLLGYAYTNTEDFLSAESAYRMASLLDPETWDWKMGLARAFFEQQRYGAAVALTDTLIREDPDRHELWLLQSNAYIGLGRPMKAAENLEIVDRLGGSTPASLNNLADIYVNDELYEPAVTAYLRALENSPEDGIERALRAARVLSAHGALDETRRLVSGIEDLREGSLSDEDRLALLKLRARLAVAEGGGEEEVRVLERIVQLDPLDGEALLLLGRHWFREGRPEKAVFYYERAANIEEFEADAKVRHAQLLVSQGDYDEALPLLRSAQTIEPRDHVQDYLEQVERIAQKR